MEKRKAESGKSGKGEVGATAGVAARFEPFINKAEVAKRLGRGVRTVEFWMQQGLLPYYKIKQSVSFKWSEVDQHLKELCRVCR